MRLEFGILAKEDLVHPNFSHRILLVYNMHIHIILKSGNINFAQIISESESKSG